VIRMKHLVVLLGFGIVAYALYRATLERPASEPSGTLPQPPAPGLDHT